MRLPRELPPTSHLTLLLVPAWLRAAKHFRVGRSPFRPRPVSPWTLLALLLALLSVLRHHRRQVQQPARKREIERERAT